MKHALPLAFALLAAAPALADGDAGAGETVFNRQCVSCHVVKNTAGETLAGRNAQTGPNLFNISQQAIGHVDGFRYGDYLPLLGNDGTAWTEESFTAYVQNPTGYLREVLGDSSARGKMAFQVRNAQDALNVWAYLLSLEEM